MKPVIVALALSLTSLSSFVIVNPASACAMRKVHAPVEDAEYVAQGIAAEQRGELHTAIRHYERAMNAASEADKADAAVRAAKVHFRLDASDRAINRLRRALDASPGHVEAHSLLGHALLASNPKEALDHFAAVVSMAPDGDRHADLALAAARVGRRDLAQSHLDLARQQGAAVERIRAVEEALGAGVAVL